MILFSCSDGTSIDEGNQNKDSLFTKHSLNCIKKPNDHVVIAVENVVRRTPKLYTSFIHENIINLNEYVSAYVHSNGKVYFYEIVLSFESSWNLCRLLLLVAIIVLLNGKGSRIDLNNNSLIICDSANRTVALRSLENQEDK